MITKNLLCSIFFERRGNKKRRRGFAREEMDRLDPNTFKKMFRLDRTTFDEVSDKIWPHMRHHNDIKAIHSSGAPILLKTRLAVSCCWLAGASYLDLCFAWGLAISTFFFILMVFCGPLLKRLMQLSILDYQVMTLFSLHI
jgi:hypothetical protein